MSDELPSGRTDRLFHHISDKLPDGHALTASPNTSQTSSPMTTTTASPTAILGKLLDGRTDRLSHLISNELPDGRTDRCGTIQTCHRYVQ